MNIRFGNFLFSNGGRLEFYAWELSPFFQFLECVCNRFSFFRRCYCVSFFLSEVPKKTPLGFLSRGTFLGMGKIRRKSPRGRLKAVFGGSQYKTLTPPRAGAWSATKKPVFMRIWGLCRRATAKPIGSRRTSADGFAVKMKRRGLWRTVFFRIACSFGRKCLKLEDAI